MRLSGLNVVVTGASSGIGLAIAEHLADRGASVWAVARSGGALEDLAGRRPTVTPFVADLAVAAERAALIEAAGPVDVLVNNAGIGWVGLMEDMPGDQVRKLYELNVLAAIELTQRVLPGMLSRRRGHIVNVASIASWVSVPPLTLYSSTKFALLGFSDGLRREVAGRGVRVTSVHPGPVATKFGERASTGDPRTDQMSDGLMPGVPASTCARAVARAIRRGRLPGYSTIAVPRLLGLTRLGALPVVRYLSDGFAVVFKGQRASALSKPER